MKYWFRPKQFWKWFAFYYPSSRRGWAVTFLLLGCGGLFFSFIEIRSSSQFYTFIFFTPFAVILMLIFDIMCFRHGEYPSWWKKNRFRISK